MLKFWAIYCLSNINIRQYIAQIYQYWFFKICNININIENQIDLYPCPPDDRCLYAALCENRVKWPSGKRTPLYFIKAKTVRTWMWRHFRSPSSKTDIPSRFENINFRAYWPWVTSQSRSGCFLACTYYFKTYFNYFSYS